MRLGITLDVNLEAIITEYAAKWNCTKAMAIRTLIYDGVRHNEA